MRLLEFKVAKHCRETAGQCLKGDKGFLASTLGQLNTLGIPDWYVY
jgi:hypothetical protein